MHLDRKLEHAIKSGLKTIRTEYFDRTGPMPATMQSVQTAAENQAKPGDLLRIVGARLKFDAADLDQGVFFQDETGEEKRSAMQAHLQPTIVITEVPGDLTPGTYLVIVRTKPNNKDLHEGILDEALVVAV